MKQAADFHSARKPRKPKAKSARKRKRGGQPKVESAQLSILDAIERIRGRGNFYAEGEIPFVSPGLSLPDGTPLEFPLSRSMAEALRKVAMPAPYGKSRETVFNEEVRQCFQLDADRLEFSSAWQAAMEAIVLRVAKELGVDGQVTAAPYKLLIYGKGGVFLPHRDTEKMESMFATLIVALPSTYRGGELVIRHGGESHQVDFSRSMRDWRDPDRDAAAELRYVAFYADCEHEVKRITSGFRVCVVYNLALKPGTPAALTLPPAEGPGGPGVLAPLLEALPPGASLHGSKPLHHRAEEPRSRPCPRSVRGFCTSGIRGTPGAGIPLPDGGSRRRL